MKQKKGPKRAKNGFSLLERDCTWLIFLPNCIFLPVFSKNQLSKAGFSFPTVPLTRNGGFFREAGRSLKFAAGRKRIRCAADCFLLQGKQNFATCKKGFSEAIFLFSGGKRNVFREQRGSYYFVSSLFRKRFIKNSERNFSLTVTKNYFLFTNHSLADRQYKSRFISGKRMKRLFIINNPSNSETKLLLKKLLPHNIRLQKYGWYNGAAIKFLTNQNFEIKTSILTNSFAR